MIILEDTKSADILHWLHSLCESLLFSLHILKPYFYCNHGNWHKMENSEIVKKFVGPLDSDFRYVPVELP